MAGQMCRGAKGKPRASGHAERHRAYLELAALGRENERLHEMQARNRDRAASR